MTNTKTVKHTDWLIVEVGETGGRGEPSIPVFDIVGPNDCYRIATIAGRERAEFIVRACNAHEDLLAACIRAHKEFANENIDYHGEPFRYDTGMYCCYLGEAIQKATRG